MQNSLLLILLLILFSLRSLAEAPKDTLESLRKQTLTPHITVATKTGEQWDVNLQRTVGANLNTNLLLSSLTLAVYTRVEIGTVPLFYLIPEHNFNFSIKYNFWRTKHFIWSVGSSFLDFALDTAELPPPYTNREASLFLQSHQLALNYFPEWTRLKFGLSYTNIQSSITGLNDTIRDLSAEDQNEAGMDITYSFNDPIDVTFGFGGLREAGISASEKVRFGFGSSIRWYRPEKLFSTPTIGIQYTPETGSVQFLVSTKIY